MFKQTPFPTNVEGNQAKNGPHGQQKDDDQ